MLNISETCPIVYIFKSFQKSIDLKLGLGVTMRITQRISKCKECSTMNKKVLIISSSPRKSGNSETLAAAFAKGARKAGHQVVTVSLRGKQVGFCKGCFACLKLGHCVIQTMPWKLPPKCTMRMCWCSQHPSTITASAVSSRLCWIVPTHCSIRTTPLRKPTCWQQRQRTHRKPLRAQKKPCRAG